MTTQRQKWVMAKRPVGLPQANDFELKNEDLPALKDGQILVTNNYLTLDPYMRGRMADIESYAKPLQIGEIITGETVGTVTESNHDDWQVGDIVCVGRGWGTHHIVGGSDPDLMRVDEKLAPQETWIGTVGMPGRTAYFGLFEVGKPQSGETLVVSAASGAVGSMVGQLAKEKGLTVVGVAGGDEKCSYCINELGFDACIDYKKTGFELELKKACPNGVDVYFENVGGSVSLAVSTLLNEGARVPICGFISNYNDFGQDTGMQTPFDIFGGMTPPPEHRFFVVTEWFDRWREATQYIAERIQSDKFKYRQTINIGFENAPAAFIDLFSGKNFGKQLLKLR